MAEGVKELAGRLIEFIDMEGTAEAKLSGLRSYLLGLVDGLEYRSEGLVQCSRCGKETLCPTMVEGYPGSYCSGCAGILMQRKHDRAMHGLGITTGVSREG